MAIGNNSIITPNGVINLITDRTQYDVDNAIKLSEKGWINMSSEEKSEYLMSLIKGSYTAVDLNRVGAAVAFIANRLNENDILVSVNPKQDWILSDIISPQEAQAYLNDIIAIRSALATMPTTPPAPDDMLDLTYTEANNIEQILLDVNQLITNMIMSMVYCGQPYCGQIWEEFTA